MKVKLLFKWNWVFYRLAFLNYGVREIFERIQQLVGLIWHGLARKLLGLNVHKYSVKAHFFQVCQYRKNILVHLKTYSIK